MTGDRVRTGPGAPRPAAAPAPAAPGAGARVAAALGNQAFARTVARNNSRPPGTQPGGRDAWTNDPGNNSVVVQGMLAAGRGGPRLALYAVGDAQAIAERNVHRHLGDPGRPPSSSVELGSARIGPGNALRHCTWSAAVTMFALRHGGTVQDAWDVLISHEPDNDAYLLDREVDIHNNLAGVNLAVRLHEEGSTSERALMDEAVAALSDGRLQMAHPDGRGRIVSTRGWRDFPPEAWQGMGQSGRRRQPAPPTRDEQEAATEGQVRELGLLLQGMRASASQADEAGVRGALQAIGALDSTARRKALADPEVGGFLEDLGLPVRVRERIRAALTAPLPDGERLPLGR